MSLQLGDNIISRPRIPVLFLSRISSFGLTAIFLVGAMAFMPVTSLVAEDAQSTTPNKTSPKATTEPISKDAPNANSKQPEPAKELYSGKVVLLLDALKRRGIKAADEMKGQVVLETESGEIWPIIADWRGRALFQDERLRNRPVELVARRPKGLPYLQVLIVFTFNEQGERQFTDYWCDICSIPMYEIKDCECCQGPIRLRFQKQDLPAYLKPVEKK